MVIVDEFEESVHERERVPIGDGEPRLEALDGFRLLKTVLETCPLWRWIHDTLDPREVWGFTWRTREGWRPSRRRR